MTRQDWHAIPAKEALATLEATSDGLSADEAKARLATYGPNLLPEQERHSLFRRFLVQFDHVLIYVLLVAAVVTAGLGHWLDMGVILAVVLANATIGFIQEGRAEEAMAAIRQMLAPHASVLRDGRRVTVDGAALVPGDVVLLEPGDRIPADLRLIAVRSLAVQEAILTGESVPVSKNAGPVASESALGDRHSMAFSGTIVTQGTAQGLVTGTGAQTEIGRIGGLIAGVEQLTTPLVQQMDHFARWLSLLILVIAGLLLLYGYAVVHRDFAELFMAVVGVAVAAIPEGLPAVMTITLAIGVQAMARRNAIVRRLPAIEAIGAVSVICTDKTGTLTRNEMAVVAVATPEGIFTVGGEGYAPSGTISPPSGRLADIALAARLCNDAELHERDGAWIVEGDPMEGALLAFAGKVDSVSGQGWSRCDEIPFDARNRYMAVLHTGPQSALLHVKGAPERVLEMCADQGTRDGVAALDVEAWRRAADEIASQGQRVLALAVRRAVPGPIAAADIDGHLTLLGLVGLIDPPRPEAVAAVADCEAAGIRVKMITGDHAGTAAAIGKQIGLANTRDVLTGADLDDLDDAQLRQEVLDTDIFARTSPEHKLRLVMALQAHGLMVAMTGDGVNDAPALKRADIGVAMGLKGSEAAKEAADLVLADDNFASIAAAVREGRTVYDNLTKVISWTLPTNAGESMTVVAALLLGLALPVTAVQILWINLITGITLGIALAFEPTEAGTMRRPPRPRGQPLLTGGLVWHVLFVSVLFLAAVFGIFAYALDRGYPLAQAQTMAMNTLVVMEIFHLFFIRNIHGASLTLAAARGTRAIWITISIATAAQFAITYLPPLQRIFGTTALSLADGLLIVTIGVVFFIVIEIEKQMRLGLRRT